LLAWLAAALGYGPRGDWKLLDTAAESANVTVQSNPGCWSGWNSAARRAVGAAPSSGFLVALEVLAERGFCELAVLKVTAELRARMIRGENEITVFTRKCKQPLAQHRLNECEVQPARARRGLAGAGRGQERGGHGLLRSWLLRSCRLLHQRDGRCPREFICISYPALVSSETSYRATGPCKLSSIPCKLPERQG
jgi:hypothetical protein